MPRTMLNSDPPPFLTWQAPDDDPQGVISGSLREISEAEWTALLPKVLEEDRPKPPSPGPVGPPAPPKGTKGGGKKKKPKAPPEEKPGFREGKEGDFLPRGREDRPGVRGGTLPPPSLVSDPDRDPEDEVQESESASPDAEETAVVAAGVFGVFVLLGALGWSIYGRKKR